MQRTKKIKIIIGIIYLILLFIFLYIFFSKFTLEEITTYRFIQTNREYLINIKETNTILLTLCFIIFTIIWVFILGFGSPILLVSGFIFGKWLGVLLAVSALAIGATILYIFAGYFFKDLIKEKFLNKFQNLEIKFKSSEFNYLLAYRFLGGIPWQLSCLLPTLFNVKISNFFLATFLGIIPQVFLVVSIGSGLEKVIDQNSNIPGIADIIFLPDIYLPLISFFVLVLVTIFLRRLFYKN